MTLALVPGLTHRLQSGIDVADVGCGAGHAINLMAGAFPASRFIGWDLSETGLAAGHAEAERKQLANVAFERIDPAVWTNLSGSISLPRSMPSTTRRGPN